MKVLKFLQSQIFSGDPLIFIKERLRQLNIPENIIQRSKVMMVHQCWIRLKFPFDSSYRKVDYRTKAYSTYAVESSLLHNGVLLKGDFNQRGDCIIRDDIESTSSDLIRFYRQIPNSSSGILEIKLKNDTFTVVNYIGVVRRGNQ